MQRQIGHRVTLFNDAPPREPGGYDEVTVFIIRCSTSAGAAAYHQTLSEFLRDQPSAIPISPGPIGEHPRGFRLTPVSGCSEYHILTVDGRHAVELVATGRAEIVTIQRAARLLDTVVTNLSALEIRAGEAPERRFTK